VSSSHAPARLRAHNATSISYAHSRHIPYDMQSLHTKILVPSRRIVEYVEARSVVIDEEEEEGTPDVNALSNISQITDATSDNNTSYASALGDMVSVRLH
jgi:hypothetical protein